MAKKKKIKPRSESIYSTTKGEVTEISLSFDAKRGDVEFDTEMINIYAETTYERPKKQKVVSRVPLTEKIQFEINEAIWNNFDYIFAIDTNTRNINGYRISVSGVIQCQKIFIIDNVGIPYRNWHFSAPFCMEFIDIKSKPENVGWMMLIQRIPFSFRNILNKQVGIVVDCDLGSLNEYNLRSRPIYEGYLLPEKIKLIYGSSDVGSDLFPNQMLRKANKISADCLKALKSGIIPFNNKRITGKPYLGFRYLIPKQVNYC